MAAQYVEPPPRDFTQSPELTPRRIARAVREGVPKTAMKSFAATLSEEEIADVTAFVFDHFVRRKALNTFYHTAANGWPAHRERYGEAYPFVLGELPIGSAPAVLTPAQRRGQRLFEDACVSCHDNEPLAPGGGDWRRLPPPRPADVPEGALEADEKGYTHEELMAHDRPPEIADLTETEARGRKLYQAACAECHAADGTGENWVGEFLQPHPTDFTDPEQRHRLTEEHVVRVVREGLTQTSMPAFRGVLDREEIGAIFAYMKRAFFAGDTPVPPAAAGGKD